MYVFVWLSVEETMCNAALHKPAYQTGVLQKTANHGHGPFPAYLATDGDRGHEFIDGTCAVSETDARDVEIFRPKFWSRFGGRLVTVLVLRQNVSVRSQDQGQVYKIPYYLS